MPTEWGNGEGDALGAREVEGRRGGGKKTGRGAVGLTHPVIRGTRQLAQLALEVQVDGEVQISLQGEEREGILVGKAAFRFPACTSLQGANPTLRGSAVAKGLLTLLQVSGTPGHLLHRPLRIHHLRPGPVSGCHSGHSATATERMGNQG